MVCLYRGGELLLNNNLFAHDDLYNGSTNGDIAMNLIYTADDDTTKFKYYYLDIFYHEKNNNKAFTRLTTRYIDTVTSTSYIRFTLEGVFEEAQYVYRSYSDYKLTKNGIYRLVSQGFYDWYGTDTGCNLSYMNENRIYIDRVVGYRLID
jgi:hypothetical protein